MKILNNIACNLNWIQIEFIEKKWDANWCRKYAYNDGVEQKRTLKRQRDSRDLSISLYLRID
jgi:hypothetical protein